MRVVRVLNSTSKTHADSTRSFLRGFRSVDSAQGRLRKSICTEFRRWFVSVYPVVARLGGVAGLEQKVVMRNFMVRSEVTVRAFVVDRACFFRRARRA